MKRGRCKISAAVLGESSLTVKLSRAIFNLLNSSQKTAARKKPCTSKRNKTNGSVVLHLAF